MNVTFRPIRGSFGCEIIGGDPNLEFDEPTFRAIEQAWFRHSFLLFRGLTMNPAQHVAFTRRLGALHIMTPPQFNLPGMPEVFVVSNAVENGREVGLKRAGLGFHTDGEDKLIPNAGSFLHALELPPEGGDTIFADMYAAWDALPAATRAKIAGRRARFSRVDLHHVHYPLMDPLTEVEKRARPDVFHPIARLHPRSGRTALYVGRWAIDVEGLPADEGRVLILQLQDHSREERFQHRHRWRVGDAVLWDNRCTQHCATEFDDTKYVRRMHRTTLEGEAPQIAELVAA